MLENASKTMERKPSFTRRTIIRLYTEQMATGQKNLKAIAHFMDIDVSFVGRVIRLYEREKQDTVS